MNTRELHDSMATGLAQHGLPVGYAERTAAELADHHRDLVEELIASGSDEPTALAEASNRLGDQKTLIKKAVREYQRRHWCGRWPLLTFLFGPVVLLYAAWLVGWLMMFCLYSLAQAGVIEPFSPLGVVNTMKYVVGMLIKTWFAFLTPAAIVYFLATRASRAALSWSWVVLAACVLAVIVGTFKCGFNQSGNIFFTGLPIRPLFSLSFVGLYEWYASDISQVCQLLLPLVVAGIFLWRSQQLAQRNRCGVSQLC